MNDGDASKVLLEFLKDPAPEQVSRIMDLYKAEGWWQGPEDPDLVRALIQGSHCFVAAFSGEGKIVGMGRAISDRASDAYIQDVTVCSGWRGQGIGTRIIQKIADRLAADGIGWIALIAERGSHPFYGRIGFFAMENAVPMKKRGS